MDKFLDKESAMIEISHKFGNNACNDIFHFSEIHKYSFVCFHSENSMLSFKRLDTRINIYLSTMTVGTRVRHPKYGPTQLFRKGVLVSELEHIFKNPRTHTGKGYATRKNPNYAQRIL